MDTHGSTQEPAEAIKTPPTHARKNIQVVAAIAIAARLHPLPIKARSKKPDGGNEWQSRTYTVNDFVPDGNIGLHLTARSRVVDADLDSECPRHGVSTLRAPASSALVRGMIASSHGDHHAPYRVVPVGWKAPSDDLSRMTSTSVVFWIGRNLITSAPVVPPTTSAVFVGSIGSGWRANAVTTKCQVRPLCMIDSPNDHELIAIVLRPVLQGF